MTNELNKKTDSELAILALRLKLQLLEGRFNITTAEGEKPKNMPAIKKMIARIMTVLTSRGLELSIGVHGISLINKKTNKQVSLNKEASETISNAEKELMKNNNAFGIGETTAEKHLDKAKSPLADSALDKDDKSILKGGVTANKTKKAAIRKTQGGGQ